MACMVPAAQMTAAEHACCQRMQHRCGAMSGSTHSCCQTQVRPDDPYAKANAAIAVAPVALSVLVFSPTALPVGDLSPRDIRIFALAHSPPGAPDHTAILRI